MTRKASACPRLSCIAREKAKWLTKACKDCGREIRYHVDWERVPDYHKECGWTKVACSICNGDLRVHLEQIVD